MTADKSDMQTNNTSYINTHETIVNLTDNNFMKISTKNYLIETTEEHPRTPTKIITTSTSFSTSVLSVKSAPSSSSFSHHLTPTPTTRISNDMPHRNFNINDIQIWRQLFQMEIDSKNGNDIKNDNCNNNIGVNNVRWNQSNELNKIVSDSLEFQFLSKLKPNDIVLYATSDE